MFIVTNGQARPPNWGSYIDTKRRYSAKITSYVEERYKKPRTYKVKVGAVIVQWYSAGLWAG
jgi:hypothetical protein